LPGLRSALINLHLDKCRDFFHSRLNLRSAPQANPAQDANTRNFSPPLQPSTSYQNSFSQYMYTPHGDISNFKYGFTCTTGNSSLQYRVCNGADHMINLSHRQVIERTLSQKISLQPFRNLSNDLSCEMCRNDNSDVNLQIDLGKSDASTGHFYLCNSPSPQEAEAVENAEDLSSYE
jgi:hypothetical protein